MLTKTRVRLFVKYTVRLVSGNLPVPENVFGVLRLGLGLELRLGLGLGLRLGLELVEIRLNTFSVKRLFGQVP